MFKKTLIILLSSFVGIISAPDYLIASDTVEIADVDGNQAIEAVIETSDKMAEEVASKVEDSKTEEKSVNQTVAVEAPKDAPASSTNKPSSSTASNARAEVKTTPAPAPTPAPVSNPDRIDIAGRSIRVEYTDTTAVDAGGVVKMYKNKFFYGHNSSSVFGFLPSVGVGTVFSVTYNGVTTKYRVSNKIEYEKSSATTLSKDGVTYKMGHIANGYSTDEVRHSISLMTCSGVSYGNGDASHRLVLFADKI